MKSIVWVSVLAVILTGCGITENAASSFKSKWIGLDREVVLYAANGTLIKTWKTSNQVEYREGFARFVDSEGRTVSVSGTLAISE